jgi:hypothetical protein
LEQKKPFLNNPNLKGKIITVELLVESVQISYFSQRNYIFLFYKAAYIDEEVKCTESSLSVRLP